MNIKNKSTDKTYSREDAPEYLLTRGCSLRTPQELERSRREIMELLKSSEDRIRRQKYEHFLM